MSSDLFSIISGQENGHRLDSRVLEEYIQNAVGEGKRDLVVKAFGQHGIGGRLWRAGNEPVSIRIESQHVY